MQSCHLLFKKTSGFAAYSPNLAHVSLRLLKKHRASFLESIARCFFFGRPMPYGEIERGLAARSSDAFLWPRIMRRQEKPLDRKENSFYPWQEQHSLRIISII